MLAVVVETNVLVSGLLTSNPGSPTVQIVDGMLAGDFPILSSPELLAEYREVLLRPKVSNCHGLTLAEVDSLLEEMVACAIWMEPSRQVKAPDPGDNHLWSLLSAYPGAIMVTGDTLLLDNPPRFAELHAPADFMRVAAAFKS